MSRKLPGSAIVPGTITVTQITGGLNDTTNASYAQANTARTTANDAYGQANTARDQANTARTQANTAYGQANAAYGAANTRLSASGGTLSGDLIITGNLTVSGNSTTLNTEVLTVEDAEVVLLSNVASTPALNAGVIVNRGTSTNTFLRWNETLDEWGWSDNGTTTYYFDDLRAGLATTNTTFGTINTSLGTINTSYQAAYAQANTAGTNALNAYGQANAAYGAANNRVLKAGDTMTGQLNISAGGLLVTGNVGIGTASPSAKLHILTGSNKNIIFKDASHTTLTANLGSAITFSRPSDGSNDLSGIFSWNDGGLVLSSRNEIIFATGGASSYSNSIETMRITRNDAGPGNVGIGTTSPQNLFHVSGSSQNVRFSNFSTDSAGLLISYQNSSTHGLHLMYRPLDATCYIDSTYQASAGTVYGDLIFRQNIAGTMTTRMIIRADGGNVGIGTASPSSILHVSSGTSGNAIVIIEADTDNNNEQDNPKLWFKADGGLTEAAIQKGDNTLDIISNVSSGGGIRFFVDANTVTGTTDPIIGATQRMVIDANGNVGIANTAPLNKLQIGSGGTSGFSGNDLMIGNGTQVMAFYQSATESAWYTNTRFALMPSGAGATGNVGIGTTNPGVALDVNGTIRSRSGAFQLNDGTTTGGGLYFYKSITGSGSVLDPSIFAEGSSGTGNVHIMTGGSITTRMWVGHNGRVGIGTTSPGNPLTVNGTIQAINGEISLTQNYGITWNNGDNYIKGVGGYHVDVTTYDGSSAQQDGIRVVGGTSKSARLIAYGGVRYGRALQSTAANKVIRGWHNYTTSGSSSGTIYVHFKTNMWAGGSPSGNIQYTMSLFRATGYSYNAHTIDSLIGFHNWSGSHYNIKITDLGSKAFWSTAYTSADGYTVLVGNLSNYNYDAVSIDWFQTYEYPFVDAWVTAQSTSANLTGVY